jgi:hypothetical protein
MTAQQQQSEPVRWTADRYVALFGGIAGLLSVAFMALAWKEAREQRVIMAEGQDLNQKIFDRAAGKVQARLRFEDYKPRLEELPEARKIRGKEHFEAVRVKSLDDLIDLNPRISVRNVGSEPIDVLRVETQFTVGGWSCGEDTFRLVEGGPWMLKEAEQEDHPLTKKLLPGQRADVSIAHGLVAQMLAAQMPSQLGQEHLGRFHVKCYARLVGASAFDEAERSATLRLVLHWVPAQLPPDKCKHFLANFKPAVDLNTPPPPPIPHN